MSPGEVWITDEHDRAGFLKFRDAFLLIASDLQKQDTRKPTATLQPQSASGNYKPLYETNSRQKAGYLQPSDHPPVIRQRRSFYETFPAKAITIFFTLFTLFLIWIIFSDGMRASNLFKLMVIILPGTVYMLYRVFFKKSAKDDHQQRYQQ